MTEPTGLFEAILAVQTEAPTLPKDKTNPHYKSRYTSLDTIVEKVGPLLAKHGLVWATLPSGTHEHPTLAYRLAHAKTGEAIQGEMPLLLDKTTAQAMGSAITYARRYSLCAVLNLVTDEDDDGTAAGTTQSRGRAAAKPKNAKSSSKASPSQIRQIREAAEGMTDLQLLNAIRAAYGADELALPANDAKTRLDAGWVNLSADKVPAVLEKIAEAKS